MNGSSQGDLLLRRRAALGLLASGAFLPLTGCDKPDEEIVPYVKASAVPGVPLRFATSLPLCGFGRGVLVTSWEGRPTKVEGNPLHPASLGATDMFAEASVLELYDPARSRTVRSQLRHPDSTTTSRPTSWDAFLAALLPQLSALQASQGEGLRIVTGHLTSPTLLRLLGDVNARFPRMRRYRHEPLADDNASAGAVAAFGQPVRSIPRLDKASVIVALDADPLGPGPLQIEMARRFAARRVVRDAGDSPCRLYSVEPVMTTTGAKADHRLCVTPSTVRSIAISLAAALGAAITAPALESPHARFVQAMAEDLRAQSGSGIVLVGEWQPPEVHALAHWINAKLRAPVDHLLAPDSDEPSGTITDLADELHRSGPTGILCVLGSNPAYDAPAALGLADAIGRVPFSVHMGLWRDETSARCTWHLPESHPLEDWGDLQAPDGTIGIAQPLIRPLHGTRSVVWLLNALMGRLDGSAYEAVRRTWSSKRPQDFETWWRRVLHDGVVTETRAPVANLPEPRLPELRPLPPSADGLVLALRPDASMLDGRFASNAWLQECPRPITTQVWGNAALMAPRDAASRRIANGDLVRLTVDGRSVSVPALIQKGQSPGVVLLALGYGRQDAGPIGTGIGASGFVLRRPDRPWYDDGLILERLGETGELLLLQTQTAIEADAGDLLHSLTLKDWQDHPAPGKDIPPPSLYPSLLPKDAYAWGMVIDNTLCIGCNACVVACQAENNVPIVGPEEIARNRDMHWLRIDTYDIGSDDRPRPGFMPVPCMHCEKAPCEPVCPVAASVHDSEGLNVQVYNRCIGTRFCQANCPYKVRRFNFFAYADDQAYANQSSALVAAQRNPDVTVRSRGVMEKCTYCVQRISSARRAAEKQDRAIAEGEVETACQRACPTRAIHFGDLHDTNSMVSALRRQKQHYAMLDHLGTRPRTTYLADVRNPNPKLAS